MKDDDALIEAMARHVAGLNGHSDDWERYLEEAADYLNFCRPIIERETREKCAKIAEEFEPDAKDYGPDVVHHIAAAIRETGMSDDILEELEEEILYASRKAWDSAQAGLSANFLGRVQDEIDRLRAENEKLRAALNGLIAAADNVRHWHDAMADNSGMVVSKDSVIALWEEAEKARAAATALKETGG